MKAELIAHMGDDLTVVNAARVSFDKESEWETKESRETVKRLYVPSYMSKDADCGPQEIEEEVVTKWRHLSARDKKLIQYLASHNHWTPFSHAMITMRETVPIFVARQRFKHVVGFTYNEVSRRYVDSEPEFYVPETWRKRAENKKQGSSHEKVFSVNFYPEKGMRPGQQAQSPQRFYDELLDHSHHVYERCIEAGVCPEQARMVLPQSMLTSYYVTGSLAAWVRAYKLRSSPDSQVEIQQLAVQWNDIIQPLFPVSWEALAHE